MIGLQTDMVAFESRLQHAKNKLTWHVPEDVRQGGRFLDIGCGTGNAVVAASILGASLSVGIDRSLEEFGSDSVREFPQICAQLGADVSKTLLVEGDMFQMRFAPGSFDYAMMLDTAEHVPDPAAFIKIAHNMLRPGGYFVLDTCPLYYSMVGAHLWNHFSPDDFPWVHLWEDFDDLARQRGIDDWTWQRFNELNKVTHDELRQAFRDAGFTIVQEHRSGPNEERLALFDGVKAKLKNEYQSKPDVLFEDWILLVGKAES